jgi:hypothetical protein
VHIIKGALWEEAQIILGFSYYKIRLYNNENPMLGKPLEVMYSIGAVRVNSEIVTR